MHKEFLTPVIALIVDIRFRKTLLSVHHVESFYWKHDFFCVGILALKAHIHYGPIGVPLLGVYSGLKIKKR